MTQIYVYVYMKIQIVLFIQLDLYYKLIHMSLYKCIHMHIYVKYLERYTLINVSLEINFGRVVVVCEQAYEYFRFFFM